MKVSVGIAELEHECGDGDRSTFLMFVALAIMRHLISIFLLNMNIAVR